MRCAMPSRRVHHGQRCSIALFGPGSYHFEPTVGRKSKRVSPRWRRSFVLFRNDHRMRRRRAAFTLIELLVTIAIIATLAAIVAPALLGNVGEARRNSARSQLQIFALALDAFRLDTDTFP